MLETFFPKQSLDCLPEFGFVGWSQLVAPEQMVRNAAESKDYIYHYNPIKTKLQRSEVDFEAHHCDGHCLLNDPTHNVSVMTKTFGIIALYWKIVVIVLNGGYHMPLNCFVISGLVLDNTTDHYSNSPFSISNFLC